MLYGQLRAVHLRTHLGDAREPDGVSNWQKYQMLRGYDAAESQSGAQARARTNGRIAAAGVAASTFVDEQVDGEAEHG